MSAPSTSALTAVVLLPRRFGELTASLFHLQRQTIARSIEVVLVHTAAGRDSIDVTRFDGFGRFTPVQVDAIPTVSDGFVAGAKVASAPIVSLVEDHVFLDPDWAERVCEAHTASCAAVVPRMRNGNAGTLTSWANFLACFDEAFALNTSGHLESGPGHNTSYKRSVLEQYDSELRTLYQSERTFHYRLRRDGHAIVGEPRAELAHVNISIPREAFAHALLGGVMFGQYRGRGMGVFEKLTRSVLAPLCRRCASGAPGGRWEPIACSTVRRRSWRLRCCPCCFWRTRLVRWAATGAWSTALRRGTSTSSSIALPASGRARGRSFCSLLRSTASRFRTLLTDCGTTSPLSSLPELWRRGFLSPRTRP
jgi:hypothetical protein